MKVVSFFFASLISLTCFAQDADETVTLREATKEEIAEIIKPEEIKKMVEEGKKLHQQTENLTREQVLLDQFKKSHTVPDPDLEQYLKLRLAQGQSKADVTNHIKDLGRKYYGSLQYQNLDKLLPEDVKLKKESELNELYEKYQKGEAEWSLVETALNDLESTIASTSISLENAKKQKEFEDKLSLILSGIDESKIVKIKESGKVSDFTLLVPENFSLNHGPLFSDPTCNTTKPEDNLPTPLDRSNFNIIKPKGLPGRFYFMWGYNRSFHSASDATFTTDEGTFTIHDTKGSDRPSPLKSWEDFKVYINPSQISIPQYNMKIGYMFNQKWGIEVSQDHMKWVFNNQLKYRMTGEFSPDLMVLNDQRENEWDIYKPIKFDEAKATGDASWLSFEHTDGYNYVNVGAVYNQNLFKTKNSNFSVDLRSSAGAGLMIPKTQVTMHRDNQWNYVGLNNKFHVAGFGAHADVRLKVTFWDRVFVEASTKGTYVKINNALVDGTSNRLAHTPISSVQLIGSVGYQQPLYKDKKKQKKKILN